ncbi:hypothetical protein [Engelhardtia mirabilis]|uniref:Uncharacterized protein n=1 Tax=Engelhardtia mirabilis TaxID=2528011 RepID=A0A518BQ51_9BACT|nr:hypothetical protein Pla133_42130 [Planctomycetes bacterium Pla133]QDV03424.1 hypothetical protein Pla86_42120 [Planctomycetes bacterium Pla86]
MGADSDQRAGEDPPPPASEVLPPGEGRRKKRPRLVEALRKVRDSGLKKGAKDVLTGAFDERRSELEELATAALRRALVEETERIERLIERSVEVKKREVRLSLLVLVAASLLYAALAWIASLLGQGAGG